MKVFKFLATKDDQVRIGVYSPAHLNQCWVDVDDFIKKGWRVCAIWQDVIEEENEE